MQTTRDFIEAIRTKHDGCSYYRVTKILEVSESAISRWKKGHGGFANDVGVRVAHELNLKPEYVLACLEAEREQSAQVRPVWAAIAKKFAGKAAGVLLTGTAMLAHQQDARASVFAVVSAPSPTTNGSSHNADQCILCNINDEPMSRRLTVLPK